MNRALVVLTFALSSLTTAPAAAETTVSTDPLAGAVIIDGFLPGSSEPGSASGWRCYLNVLAPLEGVAPQESIMEIPCLRHPDGIARVTADLREQVVRYLPPQHLRLWPSSTALVNVPVIGASGQGPVTLYARVLGEQVTINLMPTYRWRWGDGTTLETARAGRPYPAREITHTYRRACRCPVTLTTWWSGVWTASEGNSHPLDEVLTQESGMRLPVREAPIRMTR